MTDSINADDDSDRLLVAWAVDGRRRTARRRPPTSTGPIDSSPTPDDIVVLRRTDPPAVDRLALTDRGDAQRRPRRRRPSSPGSPATATTSSASRHDRARADRELRPSSASSSAASPCDLVTPFRTSFGAETDRRHPAASTSIDATARRRGLGRVRRAERARRYSAEYVDGAAARDRRSPSGPRCSPVAATRGRRRGVRAGHAPRPPDGQGRARDGGARRAAARRRAIVRRPFLGGDARPRSRAASASASSTPSTNCSNTVQGYVDDGYVRIKLKIEPGSDIEPVAAVRELIGPDMPFQVDANTAYRRTDGDHLRRLDEFDLLLIEQPLPEEDILGHAQLGRGVETPVCLDESIVSRRRRADAIELGAVRDRQHQARVGSAATSRPAASTTCASTGASRCGAAGWSRPASAAPPTPRSPRCPGFTLPGDISASTRFYAPRHRDRPDHHRRRPRHRARPLPASVSTSTTTFLDSITT